MNKLVVFCLDALCTSDLAYLRQMPNLNWVLETGSIITHAEPVYPSLTYPCHVSILTGNYVENHGIFHNEVLEVGNMNPAWYNQRSDVKCQTLLDVAKTHGYSTCSLSWPVTGGADFDLNMPMIVPINYSGNEPIQFFIKNATQELLDKYYDKHAHHLIGEDRSLDQYTMAMALDIIEDYQQPDIMLIKMCDLDSAHHMYGIHGPEIVKELRRHDHQFGQIVEAIKKYGDFENTNFVVLGDHGQSTITQGINFNILLKQNGFITVDEEDKVVDYDAYCHSASLSAWITLKDPSDKNMHNKVYQFLQSVKEDDSLGIGHLFTKNEAKDQFHLTGPFDFIIEGEKPVAFNNTLSGDEVFDHPEYKGYSKLTASHGALPWKDETTTFFLCGPNVKPGVVIDRCSIVNEAPTMAGLLGFEMADIDGKPLIEFIR